MTLEELDREAELHKNDVDICPQCGKIYYGSLNKKCYRCRRQLRPYASVSNSERVNLARKEAQHKNIPRCPTCQSTNIKKISFAKGYLHWRMLGVFSKTAMSQWECKSCGHKW